MSRLIADCMRWVPFALVVLTNNFLSGAFPEVMLPEFQERPVLYSSHDRYDNGNGIDTPLSCTLEKAIEGAESSILLMTFTCTDPKILALLNKKAMEGVSVHILADKKSNIPLARRLRPMIDIVTRDSGDGHFHHKVMVIDRKYVWIGSGNFTIDGLRKVPTLAVGVYSPEFAALLEREASYVHWQNRRLEVSHGDGRFDGQRMELYLMPHYDPLWSNPITKAMNDRALDKMLALIRGAKTRIRISMHVWTYRDLAQAVVEAHERGVNVDVVTAMPNEQAVAMMAEAGIPVMVNKNMHHKWMLIDDHILVNGSPNFSLSAFSRNDESFVVLYDLDQKQRDVVEAIWKHLNDQFFH
ncbi:MAG: hypothetical protein H7A37_08855 [Chlamydiales bacterium]|nr:hypothetical protein [Chlamydiia bacterium]MCP5508389.1 hypothetical protein [Chlamydiales bacterium]